MKKCKECEYFMILFKPQIIGGQCWDWGKVRCLKHDLVADYYSEQKLNKLICVEDKDGEV